MGGDQGRDRPKQDVRSRSSSAQREFPPPRTLPQRGASASGERDRVRAGESEPPTRPRGRTIIDSELPADPRSSVRVPAVRAAQDSIHPVRVPARSVRPPLSLWTRAWATMALVIVVGGGAIGIVASLRGRTLGADRDKHDDRSPATSGALGAQEHAVEATETAKRPAAPAAAPVAAAPPPGAPSSAVSHGVASSPAAAEASPIAASSAAASTRPAASAVAFRTTESLAVSPPVTPSAAPSPAKRTKPTEFIATPTVELKKTPPDEPAREPTPPPAASDTPESKGESEAWVTEERRF